MGQKLQGLVFHERRTISPSFAEVVAPIPFGRGLHRVIGYLRPSYVVAKLLQSGAIRARRCHPSVKIEPSRSRGNLPLPPRGAGPSQALKGGNLHAPASRMRDPARSGGSGKLEFEGRCLLPPFPAPLRIDSALPQERFYLLMHGLWREADAAPGSSVPPRGERLAHQLSPSTPHLTGAHGNGGLVANWAPKRGSNVTRPQRGASPPSPLPVTKPVRSRPGPAPPPATPRMHSEEPVEFGSTIFPRPAPPTFQAALGFLTKAEFPPNCLPPFSRFRLGVLLALPLAQRAKLPRFTAGCPDLDASTGSCWPDPWFQAFPISLLKPQPIL